MTSVSSQGWWGGIGVGSRWRSAGGAVVEVISVHRNGVVAYRSAGSPAGTENVIDVIRFTRAFAPADHDAAPDPRT